MSVYVLYTILSKMLRYTTGCPKRTSSVRSVIDIQYIIKSLHNSTTMSQKKEEI